MTQEQTDYYFQILCIHASADAFFTAICCRSDGCYMVINGGNNKILVYDAGGKLIKSNFGNRFLNRRLSEPSLITELPNQRVAIFDRTTNQIKKLSWNEDYITAFDVGLPTYSLTTNRYRHMIMAHQKGRESRIVTIRHEETGYILHTINISPSVNTVPETPFYAVYSLHSSIIVLDQSSCTLSVHTLDGARQLSMGKQGFLLGNLNSPASVCLDIRGRAIVADTKNNRVVRYKCDNSKACEILLTDIYHPLCVSFDNAEHLVVVTAKHWLLFDYDVRKPPQLRPALVDGI